MLGRPIQHHSPWHQGEAVYGALLAFMKAGLSSAGAKHQQMSFVLDISIKNLHRTTVAEARGSNFQAFF